jgi:periplasmic mercuric ion binding protein
MTRSLPTIALAAALLAGSPALAAEQTVHLAVDKMTCAGCTYIVKQALAGVPGVAQVAVSSRERAAVVTFDDAATDALALTEARASVGFPSRVVK